MNADSKWIREKLPPNVCKMCLKLVIEDRKRGLPPPKHLQCLYGHTLADFPKGCIQPEKTPYWMWTNPPPLREGRDTDV